jgi:predicted GNAT family N-acyltransferase
MVQKQLITRSLGVKAQIVEAKSKEELDALFRFRYSIYVEEMQRKQKYADHAAKTIRDPLDDFSKNITAWHDGKIIASLRLTWPRDVEPGYFDAYRRLYSMDDFHDVAWRHHSIVTRLMVDKSYRGTAMIVRFFSACYQFALERETEVSFMDCNDHLVKLFERIGWKTYKGKVNHEEYGLVTPMRLDLHDIAHFRAMKSPYAWAYQDWECRSEALSMPDFRASAAS